jgi:hypothetical protein
MDQDGRRTGVGYMKFAENYAGQEVIKYSGEIIYGKPVNVKVISHTKMMQKVEDIENSTQLIRQRRLEKQEVVIDCWEKNQDYHEKLNINHINGYCVKLRGMPKNTDYQDISLFLEGYGGGVHETYIVRNVDDANTVVDTDAYVAFNTQEVYVKALNRNTCFMGQHRIQVNPISNAKMQEMISSRLWRNHDETYEDLRY